MAPEQPRFRLAVRLADMAVRLLVPSRHREVLLGDLLEEWEARSPGGRFAADFWLVREALWGGLRAFFGGIRSRRERRALQVWAHESHVGRGSTGPLGRLLDDLRRDSRITFRKILRNPGFTALAVVSIALGVAGNTALFTLVNDLILKTPPYDDPEEIVHVRLLQPNEAFGAFSYLSFREFEDATRDVFEAASGVMYNMVNRTDETGHTENLLNELVAGPFFQVLGVEAQVGRVFDPSEGVALGADPVVVLSDAYWRRAFGADAGVVGSVLRLNGHPYTVVGVADAAFRGTFPGLVPDVWAHASMSEQISLNGAASLERRGQEAFSVMARLAPGVSLAEARAATAAFADELFATFPDSYPQAEIRVTPVLDSAIHPMLDDIVVPVAGLLMIVVALVLLIACVNLTGFLLARAEGRKREIAVRLAVGSGRSRLVRSLLTETTWIALLGGAIGVVMSVFLVDWLLAIDLPLPVPVTLDAHVDITVLAFALAISVAAGLILGLVPALQSTRADVATALKDGATGGSKRSIRMRDLLVVGQVAASVVLLVGAGLFIRSLLASQAVDPGFGHLPAALVRMELPPDREREERNEFYRTLFERVGAKPGVRHVALMSLLPLEGTGISTNTIQVPGVAPPDGQSGHEVDHAAVAGEPFAALGIEVVAGRRFERGDNLESEPVAIVNEALAQRFWPDGNALGASFQMGGRDVRVVGVTRTTKVRTLSEAPRAMLYTPMEQHSTGLGGRLIATTRLDPVALGPEILDLGNELDPGVVTINVQTMDEHLGFLLVPARISAFLLGVMGMLALALAAVGLYGIVAHSVASRDREMGIRLSIGAEPASLVRMVLRSGMAKVVIGLGIGLLLAAPLGGLVRSMLFGVEALDPATFGAAVLVLGSVGLVAAWIPAHRASRVDPMSALRAE